MKQFLNNIHYNNFITTLSQNLWITIYEQYFHNNFITTISQNFHDKLCERLFNYLIMINCDRLVTQLQHNFNTTSTQHILYFSIYFNIHFILHSTIYETILQHIFITYFHNSSTTNYSRLHHKTFTQFMMQCFITTIEWQIFHHNFITTSSQLQLITYFINKLSHIHLNKFHNNFIPNVENNSSFTTFIHYIHSLHSFNKLWYNTLS